MNISLNIALAFTKFSASIENIPMQGKVSQNFYLGLSISFMAKKLVTFVIFGCFSQLFIFRVPTQFSFSNSLCFPCPTTNIPCANLRDCDYYIHKNDLADLSS